MSMQIELPFHRKYRPKSLTNYIGNEKMKQSVMNALQGERKPQVILMQGPAGTGKTSMARLLAKEYLCEKRDITRGACDECYICKAMDEFIETGRSDILTNLREVDVTDSNKRQDVDALLEDASMPSFDGNWKIYILDECHMMTVSAQNRLLKTLEEPPEKVLLILCTTDPEKLITTIISRCQYIFQVQKPTREELTELLIQVCKIEGIPWERRALGMICVQGDFVPRNTLITLQSVANEVKEVTYEKTVQVLNMIADKYFFEFYEILVEKYIDTQRYIAFLGRLKTTMDLKTFIESLIAFTMRGIYVSNGVIVEALDVSEIKQYKELFKKFSVPDLAYLLETLLKVKESSDIETNLMTLGFKGLYKPKLVQEEQESVGLIDNSLYSSKEEKAAGDANYLESVTMTEEEKEEKIKDFGKNLDIDDIASLFGATKIIQQ